jgi:thiol-disulfide isomerase/thioredoxin
MLPFWRHRDNPRAAVHTFQAPLRGIDVKRTPLLILLALAAAPLVTAAPTEPPEFSHSSSDDWINSPPLKLSALKGKVVMIEFWAFECDNCLKSRAWVDSLERTLGPKGLLVVGVHTPELNEEMSPDAVRKAVVRLGIHDPVMLDQDKTYWDKLHVQYWPTFCLIGRDGLLYACVPGEMHSGDQRADSVERAIDLLLKAPT